MLLSETWLRPSTPNRLLVIRGYFISRVDRPDGRGYGGVAIITKVDITTVALKPPGSQCPDSQLESQWALLKLPRHRNLIVCSVYRPPRYSVTALRADFTDLETQLQRVLIDHPNVPFVICGDLNCDMLKSANSPARQHISEFLTDYSLDQLVTTSTFATGSLLDVCIVKSRTFVHSCSVVHCHFRPHKFIHVIADLPKQRLKPTVIQSRSFNRMDVHSINQELLTVDWHEVHNSMLVADKWQAFLDNFLPVFDDHAPLKNVLIRNPTAPPASAATREIISRHRSALRRLGRESPEYKALNRSVRAALRRDRRHDLQNEISERGVNKVWQSIKSVIAGKKDGPNIQPDLSPDDLNSFFVSVGPRIAAELSTQNTYTGLNVRLPRVGACSFKPRAITLGELGHTVFSMRNSAARGTDGICIRMLKACFQTIGDIILHIINISITRSDIPNSWKHSIVQPIFKSGNPSDPSNFRPISIVPVIMKIIERVIHQQLYHYLSQNHLLSPTQHGFRPRHSTETALLSVTDSILAATDRGEISMLCFIDLSKCFDVIDHEILVKKLQMHGIETSWFSAYLQGHTQSVSLTDKTGRKITSRPLPNTVGVFQGSALGPLLFTIFSNDLSLFAGDATAYQYADDTQILVSGPRNGIRSLISRMEASLASLNAWFCAHALKVNASKTQLMVFGSRQNLRNLPRFKISFRDAELQPCAQARNLGVVFDGALTWEAHIAELSRRCTGVLIGLSHARHCLPDGILKTIVTALVISRVQYCLTIYGNGSQQNFDRLQKIMNFAARVIFGRRKFDHVSGLRDSLGWIPPKAMADIQTLITAQKIVRNGEPEELAAMFKNNSDARERSTRQDHLLHLPRSRLETGKRRFGYRAAALINSLPPGAIEQRSAQFARTAKAAVCPAITIARR